MQRGGRAGAILMTRTMRAWVVEQPRPVAHGPVRMVERVMPQPGPGEVLVRVEACGVCRTDLHLAEGDLPPHRPGTVPGHQVVGVVETAAEPAGRFTVGDRVGIAWLRGTCGECRWCRSGRVNLCPDSTYTGWDADGGFAEYTVVPTAFAYRLPDDLTPVEAAPLLCGGIIGYRALKRSDLPPGGRLGIYGFGSSAHLTAQIALAQGASLYVMTRGEANRRLAQDLGAAWVGGPDAEPPVRLDSAIVFASAGELVPVALSMLDRGGTLALAGIHMTEIPPLDYQRHLFLERNLRSVTANTRRDGEELLTVASRLGVRAHATPYAFTAVDAALRDLADGVLSGSAVLTMP